eukprot:gnl/MRDRNA2_/MRDRNA2_28776_c0_seq1.p1 gnl/MRDRNA2_/MRDRNA2_28776_c0~~gnl/MRDRNA2_/MRDRNA2_28776_c0_seq1.p1  ORF type:complete len:1296 (+),score=203.13 gnl/MRDRNA2_/MRDRNA2_28776_c0_seq1:177-4064(+)
MQSLAARLSMSAKPAKGGARGYSPRTMDDDIGALQNNLTMAKSSSALQPAKREFKKEVSEKGNDNVRFADMAKRNAMSGLPSTMKISVEIQQLIIQFNEILGISPEKSDVRINTRPYLKYFHSAVEKVTSSLRRLLEQKTIQKSVFGWIDANLEVLDGRAPARKEITNDDVIREANREIKYWDRVHVEAGHDIKSGRVIFQPRLFATGGKDERRWTMERQKTSSWGKSASKGSLSSMLYDRICGLKSDALRDDLLPLAGAEYSYGTLEEREKLEQVVTKSESSRFKKLTQKNSTKTGAKTKKSLAAILRDCFKQQSDQVTFVTLPADSEFDSSGGNAESLSFSQYNSVYSQMSPQNSTYDEHATSSQYNQYRQYNRVNQYSVEESYQSVVVEEDASPRSGHKLVSRFRNRRDAGAQPVRNVIPTHSKTRQAEKRYVQTCTDQGVLPGREGLHCAVAKDVNLAGQNLDDKAVRAIAGAIEQRNQDIETLNLSGNRATDKSMAVLLQSLECPLPKTLDVLNISKNRLGSGSFDVLSQMLRNRQLDVRCLKMSGITIPTFSFKSLCGAIISNGSVRQIDLSDTQCGRHCQDPCVQVASLCYAVDNLDISQNFFRDEGLKELGQNLQESASHLNTLSFADNTWVLQQNAASATGRQSKSSKKPSPVVLDMDGERKARDPINDFCEALGYNTTLTYLDLSGCQIGEEAALCLEDALQDHAAIRQLNLSRNPLGDCGLRAILRMVMKTGNVQLVTLTSIRESATKPSVSFSYTDLTEDFHDHAALDMSDPYHRAIMRLIIRRVGDFGVSIADGLQDFKIDGKSQMPHFERKNGHWHVPNSGICEFLYHLDPISPDITSPAEAVRAWQGCRRMRVRFSRFVILVHIWRQLSVESEQRLFLLAAAKDLLFKLGQVTFLAKEVALVNATLITDMLCGFTSTFENADRATINLALRCVRGKMPMKHIFNDYMTKNGAVLRFNPDNCTGRYRLSLENAGEYSVAEQLLVVNQWEAHLAQTRGLMDTGEAGAHFGIRNFSHGGVDTIYNPGFVLPGDGFVGKGLLKCDYVTPLARPKRSATVKKLPPVQFNRFLALIQGEGTDASEKSRLETLRAVSHRMYLTAKQVHQILTSLSKEYITLMYVCLFPRCLDFGPPMIDRVHGILSDENLFDMGTLKELEDRLGMPNTLDCLNIHLPPWNHFCWDLTKRDQHICAYLAVVLAAIEPGENIKNPNWTKAHVLKGATGSWLVPTSWSDSLPAKGMFSMKYICEQDSPEYIMVDKRKELGRKYLGWVSANMPEDAASKPA